MKPRYFLVTSRGQMATTWLTSALNAIPGILAVHGSSPEAALIDQEAPLGDRLRQLSRVRPANHYGFVHCVNDAMILKSLKGGDLHGLNPTVVQLFRNPIMLMEAMACNVAERFDAEEKYRTEGQHMREQVLSGRWRKVAVTWPETVRQAVMTVDETVFPRLTGLWWRCALEAEEAAGFETMKMRLAQMGAEAPFSPPTYFQFEDYTAKRDVFAALVTAVSGGEAVDPAAIEKAFGSPLINRQRRDSEPDPERVWTSWSKTEQDLFAAICAVTGLKSFFEGRGLYQLPFVR